MAWPAEGRLAESKRQSDLHTSPATLALLAGVPVLLALWALLSPRLVLSREMTWDFLYNLSGAWHLRHGHVAHVDFHEPVGQLNFMLTLLGFDLVGPTPFAFLVGVTIVTAVVFASASFAAMRRLPVLPAALFVTFVSLLVLMPANVGDRPDAYSFAMSYNRYGWSLLSILALILFVPPHDGHAGGGIDVVHAGLLLVALFYLKITYFAGGLAFVGLALLISPHIRARLPAWLAIAGLVVANTVAPWNHAYLLDILHAAEAGAVRNSAGLLSSTTSLPTPKATRPTPQASWSRSGCMRAVSRRRAHRSPSRESWRSAPSCCRRTISRTACRSASLSLSCCTARSARASAPRCRSCRR